MPKPRPSLAASMLLLAALLLPGLPAMAGGLQAIGDVASPDGRVRAELSIDADGVPHYAIRAHGRILLQPSPLGLRLENGDFARGLELVEAGETRPVEDRYELSTGKRRLNEYHGHRRVFAWRNADGRPMETVFQVSDDGVAFRYRLPGSGDAVQRLREETTAFRFAAGTHAWLQPMSAAKTGWSRTNPSYEEYYLQDVAVGTPSPIGDGWVYPALFRQGDAWVLISEGSLSRGHAGTRLRDGETPGEYRIGLPDPHEHFQGGPVAPEFALPWQSPWRIVAVGSLKTIAESTLGTDLADPPASAPVRPAEPGKASWSWPLLGDDMTVFEVQKRFIDYAADMGWRYTLIDSMWDQQIGDDRMRELVEYAGGKGVRILVWYNSSGDWNDTHQTPRDRLLTREGRAREFERMRALGVAGLKVDFFGGDGQSVIGYYLDILEESAPYGFLLNFHGATLPRGWQRTYPHLMTVEAVRGLEFATFDQANADRAPVHVATVPFARNVFDPMDYTPMALDRLVPDPARDIERRNTAAFELAQSVLFVSGIQHYAEIPEGMAKAPDYVRDFLRAVPSVWEDSRFVDGYPGRFAVFARRGGGRWYVAGVNADTEARSLELDLGELAGAARGGTLIGDGDGPLGFSQRQVRLEDDSTLKVQIPARGGFVLTLGRDGADADTDVEGADERDELEGAAMTKTPTKNRNRYPGESRDPS
ncbi:glycoside hydrolase family 97 protein [Luteimonas salinilitoris]|uniref:Glycoside hydrolase family 97 catalytic domain-containing protein n=1 Tax=Luteimonas salinilitoris TaxID=3237697 RepID=A0ABV4HK16_9GAMM